VELLTLLVILNMLDSTWMIDWRLFFKKIRKKKPSLWLVLDLVVLVHSRGQWIKGV